MVDFYDRGHGVEVGPFLRPRARVDRKQQLARLFGAIRRLLLGPGPRR